MLVRALRIRTVCGMHNYAWVAALDLPIRLYRLIKINNYGCGIIYEYKNCSYDLRVHFEKTVIYEYNNVASTKTVIYEYTV